MRLRTRPILVSVGGAALLLALTAMPMNWFAPARFVLLLPGFLLATPFWPEGIHSSNAASEVGIWLMLAVIYLLSGAFWAAVLYFSHTLIRRRRSSAPWTR